MADASGRVAVDYNSPDGPTVTHMRGMLVMNFLSKLRKRGFEEGYLKLLPPEARGGLDGVIASSWVEVDTALVHFRACEGLAIPDDQLEEFGRELASRVSETWLGTIVRAARNSGFEAMGAVLKQNDRSFSRMYKGGRTKLIEYSAKEMVIEDHGNPLLSSQPFRGSYLGYVKGLAELFTKTAYVQPVPLLQPDRYGIATRISWV
jgi:hypothetical protein